MYISYKNNIYNCIIKGKILNKKIFHLDKLLINIKFGSENSINEIKNIIIYNLKKINFLKSDIYYFEIKNNNIYLKKLCKNQNLIQNTLYFLSQKFIEGDCEEIFIGKNLLKVLN